MFYILPALFYCFCTLRSWGRGAGFFSSQGPPQCIEQCWIIPLVVSASILMHNKIIWGSLQICWLLKPFAGKTGVSLFKNLRSLGIYVLGKDLSVYIIIFFKFYFIFKLYIIVLVLPNIKMNPPQVYMCSPSWTPLPPPSHTIPLGRPSALAPSIQYCASNLDWHLVSYMIFYMFQSHSPKSSHPLPLPQIHKTVLHISVSFAVSYTGLLLTSF